MNVLKIYNLFDVCFDGCAIGLKAKSGELLKKPWRVLTNDNNIHSALKPLVCSNRGRTTDHTHAECRGDDCKSSENYTFRFTRIVHRAIAKTALRISKGQDVNIQGSVSYEVCVNEGCSHEVCVCLPAHQTSSLNFCVLAAPMSLRLAPRALLSMSDDTEDRAFVAPVLRQLLTAFPPTQGGAAPPPAPPLSALFSSRKAKAVSPYNAMAISDPPLVFPPDPIEFSTSVPKMSYSQKMLKSGRKSSMFASGLKLRYYQPKQFGNRLFIDTSEFGEWSWPTGGSCPPLAALYDARSKVMWKDKTVLGKSQYYRWEEIPNMQFGGVAVTSSANTVMHSQNSGGMTYLSHWMAAAELGEARQGRIGELARWMAVPRPDASAQWQNTFCNLDIFQPARRKPDGTMDWVPTGVPGHQGVKVDQQVEPTKA